MQNNKTATTTVAKMGTGLLTTMLFLFTLGMLSHTVSDSAFQQSQSNSYNHTHHQNWFE